MTTNYRMWLPLLGALLCLIAGGCGEKEEPDDPTKPGLITAKVLAKGKVDGAIPYGVAISPDGKLAVTGGDRVLRVWSIPGAKEVKQIQAVPPDAKHGVVTNVFFASDGKQVGGGVISPSGGRVVIWDLETGKEVPHPVPGGVLPQSEQELAFVRVSGNTLAEERS